MWKDRWRYWFEEARECGSAVGFRAAVDINHGIDEVQFFFRARGGDVEQSPLLIVIVKIILKPARRKPSISHPDQKHVVPLETFGRMHRRERDKTATASRRVFLNRDGQLAMISSQ